MLDRIPRVDLATLPTPLERGPELPGGARLCDEAIVWAARHGGWVLDRTYTGKGFSGLLDNATSGRWPADDVVFIHTGGTPAVFGCNGLPAFGSPA